MRSSWRVKIEFSLLSALTAVPLLFAVIGMPILTADKASAHSGGLNAEGCHNNRKTGDYHCHRGGSAKPREAPQRIMGGRSGTYFQNCSEARAAGAAPIRRGEPGYRPGLDRDSDGVACE